MAGVAAAPDLVCFLGAVVHSLDSGRAQMAVLHQTGAGNQERFVGTAARAQMVGRRGGRIGMARRARREGFV